jgi:hypothetical protein
MTVAADQPKAGTERSPREEAMRAVKAKMFRKP